MSMDGFSLPPRPTATTTERSFLANAAHELRTPLHSANGFVEMVLDGLAGPLNERQREMLTYAHVAIGQLAVLIEDVLFVARADSGEILPHPTTVDPAAILARAIENTRDLAQEQSVTLTWRTSKLPPTIQADSERLREGIEGLLRGGLAMMLTGGVMDVTATTDERTLSLKVSLEHVRISATDRRHLFDRFYQPRPLSSDRSAQLGLGLVVAQTTARWHGGQVRTEASSDGSLILSYELPLTRS